jgi:acyl-coenzyme A synthetase/AMP-(fatty) acid ligase
VSAPVVPRVLHRGRWWSADELDVMARCWHATARDVLGDRAPLVATALPATPDGVALFAALTARPSPVVLLAPDPRAWRTDPPVPAGTPVVLPPSLAHLGPEAEKRGLRPIVVPDPDPSRAEPAPLPLLQAPGVVLFTSGSTGAPRPVFRPMAALCAGVMARGHALQLRPGAGILIGVSITSGQGLTYLIEAMRLGGAFGLLDPVDPRAALKALGLADFQCWRATPHFADVLGRCALTGPAVVPPFCVLSSPISPAVFDRFVDRFGVPLRQSYSSSEAGAITLEDAPAPAVARDTVGRPLEGVELAIGDHPATPLSAGEIGRVWVRSPWQMAGYGFPPTVSRSGEIDGWWPTRDLGARDVDGRLRLHGRLDDCIRTRENRLVNLALVAASLRSLTGVAEAAVVPLEGPAGPSFGAVVECEPGITVAMLRKELAEKLPPWSWPREVEPVRALPRLANGKTDRRACIALLDRRASP